MTHLPTMCQFSTQGIKKIRLPPFFLDSPRFANLLFFITILKSPLLAAFWKPHPHSVLYSKHLKKSDNPPPFYHWRSPRFCQPLIFYKYPFLLLFRDLFPRKQESPLESTLDSKYQSKAAVSHAVNIFQANNQKKYFCRLPRERLELLYVADGVMGNYNLKRSAF